MTLNQLFNYYNVTKKDIETKLIGADRNYKEGIHYAKKEIAGERLLKDRGVWQDLFPGKRVIQVKDTSLQRQGIDYIVHNGDGTMINIDIKVNIGDYTDNYQNDIVPVELTQNGKRTITADKKTDYILFVNINIVPEEYKCFLVPYSEVLKIVDSNEGLSPKTIDDPYFTEDRGRTESKSQGYYVKFPIKNLKIGIEEVDGEIIDTEKRIQAIYDSFKLM